MNAQQGSGGAGAVEPGKPVVQKGRPVVRRPDVEIERDRKRAAGLD